MTTTAEPADPAAARQRFEALLDQGGRVRPLARRLLGQDADDGLQEVFAATLRSLPTFRGEAQVTTWFHRLAIRVLTTYRRRRDARAQRERLGNELDGSLSDAAMRALNASPLVMVSANERRQRVLGALDRLPPHLREVLLLRGEGLPYAEIAAALDVPLGTVKSRIATATIALAERLPAAEELLP